MRLVADLFYDLSVDLSARRFRVLLLLIAVALSTGLLVTAIAVSEMAARQIDADLAAEGTNSLTVEVVPTPTSSGSPLLSRSGVSSNFFPVEALGRIQQIDGVTDVGLRLSMRDDISVSRAPQWGGAWSTFSSLSGVDVFGATSGYLGARGITVQRGWMLDQGAPFDVVMVSRPVAQDMGIPLDAGDYSGYRVYLNGDPYDVIGVVDMGAAAVVVPYAKALAASSSDREATLTVQTEPGAGAPVASVLREAVRADRPELLRVSSTVDLANLRTGVATQLDRLAAAIGVLLLMLTAFLVANSMVVSVVARTAEIGLRRAMGAGRGDVALLFIAEGGVIGVLGGLSGSALACAVVVVVAFVSDWSAWLHLWHVVAGPLVGLVVGVAASAYPAKRASRISPAEAVRFE